MTGSIGSGVGFFVGFGEGSNVGKGVGSSVTGDSDGDGVLQISTWSHENVPKTEMQQSASVA